MTWTKKRKEPKGKKKHKIQNQKTPPTHQNKKYLANPGFFLFPGFLKGFVPGAKTPPLTPQSTYLLFSKVSQILPLFFLTLVFSQTIQGNVFTHPPRCHNLEGKFCFPGHHPPHHIRGFLGVGVFDLSFGKQRPQPPWGLFRLLCPWKGCFFVPRPLPLQFFLPTPNFYPFLPKFVRHPTHIYAQFMVLTPFGVCGWGCCPFLGAQKKQTDPSVFFFPPRPFCVLPQKPGFHKNHPGTTIFRVSHPLLTLTHPHEGFLWLKEKLT